MNEILKERRHPFRDMKSVVFQINSMVFHKHVLCGESLQKEGN